MNKTTPSLPAGRQLLDWKASVRWLRTSGLLLGVAALAGSSFLFAGSLRANTELDVANNLASGSDLTLASSYTGGTAPTATSDVTFNAANTYASPYDFGSAITIGSLNDLSATAITIQGGNGALTLSGGDSVSGNTTDLLFVGANANLTFSNTTTQSIALGASGNFDVAGTAAISAPITGTFGLTKTGAGTLTLTSNTGTGFTGGTTVSAGTLALGAGSGTGAGVLRGVVTVNNGATLSLTGNNALGYNNGFQVTTVNINGGTVNTTGALGDEGFHTSFVLTGGTLSYTGSNTTNAYQFDAGNSTAPGITSNASATTSLISGGLNIRSGTLGFNVARGTTASGVDLSVTGAITDGSTSQNPTNPGANSFGIVKTGAGNLVLSANNTFTAGTTVNGGTLTLNFGGPFGTVRGTVNVNAGATLALATGDSLGYNSTANTVTLINVNGGTVNDLVAANQGFLASVSLTGGTMTSTGGGTYNFNTGTTSITSNASAAVSTISGGVTLRNGGSLPVNVASGGAGTNTGSDLTISGVIGQNGGTNGLTKNGTGILQLTAANTYTGVTAVTAGSLFVSGGTTASYTGGVTTTNAGTVFGGTGTVGGALTIGAGTTLTVGNHTATTPAIGSLTTGAVTLAAGSTFNAVLAGNNSLSTLTANVGTITLTGASFSLTLTPGATFTNGALLELITTPTTGAFTNSTYTAGGYTFTADYNDLNAPDPNSFAVIVSTAVPEPSTWAGVLLAGGLLGLAYRRRTPLAPTETGWRFKPRPRRPAAPNK